MAVRHTKNSGPGQDDGEGKAIVVHGGDDACEKIRDVFAAMGVAASSVASTKRNKAHVRRWHAAQGALSHSWQFVEIAGSASDVDTKQLSFELVRCQPVSQDGEVEDDGDYEDEKAKRSLEKAAFCWISTPGTLRRPWIC